MKVNKIGLRGGWGASKILLCRSATAISADTTHFPVFHVLPSHYHPILLRIQVPQPINLAQSINFKELYWNQQSFTWQNFVDKKKQWRNRRPRSITTSFIGLWIIGPLLQECCSTPHTCRILLQEKSWVLIDKPLNPHTNRMAGGTWVRGTLGCGWQHFIWLGKDSLYFLYFCVLNLRPISFYFWTSNRGRIQDFSRGDNSKRVGRCQPIFPKTVWKWRKLCRSISEA